MQCQLLYVVLLIVGTYTLEYDYEMEETEDSLACEDESDVVCNFINRLIKGTTNKPTGKQLLETVHSKELSCARSLNKQRAEFSSKISIVRDSLRVMNETVQKLSIREKKLELDIKSKQEEAAELRNQLNKLNNAENEQNAQVLAEKRSLEAELALARERIVELESELDKVKKEKNNMKREIKKLSEVNKSLIDGNNELMNQTARACALHVKTITDLETQVEKLKQQQDQERDTCNTKLETLEDNAKKCGVQNENVNFNLEQCKKGEDILNLQLQNLTNEVKETKVVLDSVKSECKTKEEKCEEKEQTINEKVKTLQLDAEKCEAEKKQLETDKDQLKEQTSTHNDKNSQLLEEKRNLEADLAAARVRILKLESDLDTEKKEKNNLKEEVVKVSELNRALVTENKDLMNNNNKTATSCARQGKAITDLETKVETMKQQQAQERETLNTKLNKLEEDAKKCEVENKNANSNLEQCKNGADILKTQLQDLTNEVKETKIVLDSVKSDCKVNEEKCTEKERTANEDVKTLQLDVKKCKGDKQILETDKRKIERELTTKNEELEKCMTATSTTKFFTTTDLPLPKDAVRLSTGIYIFNFNRMSWDNARKFCKSRSMDLVSIESAEENQAITKQMRIIGHDENSKDRAIEFPVWTSGCYKNATQSWSWQSTSSQFTYENWDTTQEIENTEKQCVVLFTFSDKWFRTPKTSRFSFICEL